MSQKTLIWFRQDLRLADNPALYEAAQKGEVLAIYILDDETAGAWKMGEASRWYLHHSLDALNQSLDGKLHFYQGNASDIILKLIDKYHFDAVYWNRCYEPWRIKADTNLKTKLSICKSFNASLLWEPWQVLKQDGTPYKVFTPYYKNGCLRNVLPRKVLPEPKKLNLLSDPHMAVSLKNLALLPEISWDKQMQKCWQIGEEAAHKRFKLFLKTEISQYKERRDFPAQNVTSRLSPSLHFGEISPHQIWYSTPENGAEFLRELIWREFSYYLLYHFPHLPHDNFQEKFNHFPWQFNAKHLKAWQQGKTGYPLVDAGMRELWQTGYMHNRVRMVVASFLVKNLLIHWHHGEKWFWDCLVDADLASNSASWQWVAGSGADAAPYFRVFNPITQGEKFDKLGEYTKKYVPELSKLPTKYLYQPWLAPKEILMRAGIDLGKTYPLPLVDIQISRQRALKAYAQCN